MVAADVVNETLDEGEAGALRLDGLITHTRPALDARAAYEQAFNDGACLKMILEWEH